MNDSRLIISQNWNHVPEMTDYRSEWLSDVLVERATWLPETSPVFLEEVMDEVIIGGSRFVWMRFWLKETHQIIEKYFDADGKEIGFRVPVTLSFQEKGKALRAENILLSLWIDNEQRITVLGEEEFDRAVASSHLTPVEIEQAEHRIRELNQLIGKGKFPPPLVRNFALSSPATTDSNN